MAVIGRTESKARLLSQAQQPGVGDRVGEREEELDVAVEPVS